MFRSVALSLPSFSIVTLSTRSAGQSNLSRVYASYRSFIVVFAPALRSWVQSYPRRPHSARSGHGCVRQIRCQRATAAKSRVGSPLNLHDAVLSLGRRWRDRWFSEAICWHLSKPDDLLKCFGDKVGDRELVRNNATYVFEVTTGFVRLGCKIEGTEKRAVCRPLS